MRHQGRARDPTIGGRQDAMQTILDSHLGDRIAAPDLLAIAYAPMQLEPNLAVRQVEQRAFEIFKLLGVFLLAPRSVG